MLIGQIHVDRTLPGMHETTTAARKLMHRFKEDQVLELMDEVEKMSPTEISDSHKHAL
ncbi:Pre-mRNA-splicing factor [Venturia inaequalis]|nr:Pre-mRNA-splicing factor [Venturia inaequalis]